MAALRAVKQCALRRAKPKALDPSQLPPTVKANANFCQAQMLVTSAGTDNATGLFLGSVMVTTSNVGPVAVPTPWTITIANPYYLGVSQVRVLGLCLIAGAQPNHCYYSWQMPPTCMHKRCPYQSHMPHHALVCACQRRSVYALLCAGVWAVTASVHDRRDTDGSGGRLLGCALAALHKFSFSRVPDPKQITGAASAKHGEQQSGLALLLKGVGSYHSLSLSTQ